MKETTSTDGGELMDNIYDAAMQQLDCTRAKFGQAWAALCGAENVLHNLRAERERLKAASAEGRRQWESAMSEGDGSLNPVAEELDAAIAQNDRRVDRLDILIETQSLKVLDLRTVASKAAGKYHSDYSTLAMQCAEAALSELLQTLPALIGLPVRQLIGLFQVAGLSVNDAVRKITGKVEALTKGNHEAIALAALEQNADASPALSAFPGGLPFEVRKAIRHAPSPAQEVKMQHNQDFKLRLALGKEPMQGTRSGMTL